MCCIGCAKLSTSHCPIVTSSSGDQHHLVANLNILTSNTSRTVSHSQCSVTSSELCTLVNSGGSCCCLIDGNNLTRLVCSSSGTELCTDHSHITTTSCSTIEGSTGDLNNLSGVTCNTIAQYEVSISSSKSSVTDVNRCSARGNVCNLCIELCVNSTCSCSKSRRATCDVSPPWKVPVTALVSIPNDGGLHHLDVVCDNGCVHKHVSEKCRLSKVGRVNCQTRSCISSGDTWEDLNLVV